MVQKIVERGLSRVRERAAKLWQFAAKEVAGLDARAEAAAIHRAADAYSQAASAWDSDAGVGHQVAEERPAEDGAASNVSVTAPFLAGATVEVRVAFAKATSDVNREPLL